MIRCEWLVYERRPRWVPALRLALESPQAAGNMSHRIREVRLLHEVASQMLEHSATVVALEVHRGNFAEVLDLLRASDQHFPRARCTALLDRSLTTDATPTTSSAIADALREAGAAEIADSPRRLHAIVRLAERQAAIVVSNAAPDGNLSIAAHAWASLPWQPR